MQTLHIRLFIAVNQSLIVGNVATLLDKYDMPDEASTGGLGIKRGPGRPKRISKALKID